MNDRKTILLIEDNEDDIELTVRAFQKLSIANNIDIVKDGQEALDYLYAKGTHADRDPTNLPSLILLDLQLPKLNGLQVLETIRSETTTRFVPVVILTTSREEQDLINGYKFGANSYIRKPVDFLQFAEAVKQLGFYWLLLNEKPPTD